MAGGDGTLNIKLTTDKKIAETSSKGNQEKWLEDSTWYKLDQFGYEALAEVMTSKLLEHSNIESETPFTFVRYEMKKVKVHGRDKQKLFEKRSVYTHCQCTVPAVIKPTFDQTARKASKR